MSLDDFFAKKSRKAKKGKINPMQLLEQITNDAPQPTKSETEKKLEDLVNAPVEDSEDWDPIVNDDVELDLANIRIGDLSVVNAEMEQAVADTMESTCKADESKVVWGGKTNGDKSVIIDETEEKPVASSETGAYVVPHLRPGGSRIVNTQVQPNLESAEEFPSLDEAAQEKPKKGPAEKLESNDDSWTEVNKFSQGHKAEDISKLSYTPPALRGGPSDFQTKKIQSSYSQRLEGRIDPSSMENRQVSPWVRGSATTSKVSALVIESNRPSGWTRGATTSTNTNVPVSNSDGPKPYVNPSQRKFVDFAQTNRFAHLDETS